MNSQKNVRLKLILLIYGFFSILIRNNLRFTFFSIVKITYLFQYDKAIYFLMIIH